MRAATIVTEENYGVDAEATPLAQFETGGVRRFYRLSTPNSRSAASVKETLQLDLAPIEDAIGRADDIVYLAFTSGTTSDPKGVLHSNNTLLANARSLAGDWKINAASVVFTLSPLSHNLGFGALVMTLLVGAELVIHDTRGGTKLLERLRETGATFLFGVPSHAADLLTELETTGANGLDALKGFRISGAAAPRPLIEKLLSHGIRPQSGYGMTEACSHHYTMPDEEAEKVVETSGRACPGYEVAIFSADDPDTPLPAGEVGQIGGRGASLMLGYFDDQQATETAFNRDGWFMTGDLGQLDEDGYLRITGRLKELIIRGGHNINPARIESLAMRHPDVDRVAAIPVPDERLGEKVCIVVEARKGTAVDAADLLNRLVEEGLSKFDLPEYFLAVDEIPLGPSGKILKRALLPGIEDGRLKPQPIRWQAAQEREAEGKQQ
jgi:acyl-CoA synthetase